MQEFKRICNIKCHLQWPTKWWDAHNVTRTAVSGSPGGNLLACLRANPGNSCVLSKQVCSQRAILLVHGVLEIGSGRYWSHWDKITYLAFVGGWRVGGVGLGGGWCCRNSPFPSIQVRSEPQSVQIHHAISLVACVGELLWQAHGRAASLLLGVFGKPTHGWSSFGPFSHNYQSSMCREIRTWIVCATSQASNWPSFGHERKGQIQKSRFRNITVQFFSKLQPADFTVEQCTKILNFLNRGLVLDWAYSVGLIHPSPSLEPSAAFEGWIEKLAKVLQNERKRSLKWRHRGRRYFICIVFAHSG